MSSPESWKTVSWSGKNALVNLFSMLFFLFRNSESHRISTVTCGVHSNSKKAIQSQQWPQCWLFLRWRSSRRAQPATDVSEEWCSMTVRWPERSTEFVLLLSSCLRCERIFCFCKRAERNLKRNKDNQRYRMSLAWGERVNRVAFFSSKRDVRQKR